MWWNIFLKLLDYSWYLTPELCEGFLFTVEMKR